MWLAWDERVKTECLTFLLDKCFCEGEEERSQVTNVGGDRGTGGGAVGMTSPETERRLRAFSSHMAANCTRGFEPNKNKNAQ